MTSLDNMIIAGFLDSAAGNSKGGGDYAAIATVGMDGDGYFYALDLWLQRAAPTKQISAMFDLHKRWRYTHFGIETNCFQQLLLLPIEEERKRRKQANERDRNGQAAWQLPLHPINHHQNKETRIATLEPLLSNGWLRLSADLPEEFWNQLACFPRGKHDDALDALEGAISLLRNMKVESRASKPRATVRKMKNF
ncbi:MAG: phage terminase large subunit [Candidatus Sumerlaeia bacterium]